MVLNITTQQEDLKHPESNQTLNGLTDVNTTGVLNGDSIVYVQSSQSWGVGKPTYNLTNLQDVDTAGATNGSVLAYDGGTGSWVASTSQDIILRNVDETTRDAIADVANGMVIYNTTSNKAQVYANGSWVDLH